MAWWGTNNNNIDNDDDGDVVVDYKLYKPKLNSLCDKTIVITGGTTGLGLESAKRLCVIGGANVIITARNQEKGTQAIQCVMDYWNQERGSSATSDNTDIMISYKVINFDDLESIRTSIQDNDDWKDVQKIDVLINNAGIMAIPNRQITIDGYERQIQSNHLGHFLLTKLLYPKISKTTNARIINVSSEAHKITSMTNGIDFKYIWKADNGRYGDWKSYGQSKLANILFTKELQRRVDQIDHLNWRVVTLHPGTVSTDLARYIVGEDNYNKLKTGKSGFISETIAKIASSFLKTPEQGASTHIYLASTLDDTNVIGGEYYIDCKQRILDDYATNQKDAIRLWEESEQRINGKFDL